MLTDAELGTAFIAYYAFYLPIALCSQAFYIYLIVLHSPKHFRAVKLFLLISVVCCTFISLAVFYLQARVVYFAVDDKMYYALVCNGPCKHAGPGFCFAAYTLHLGAYSLISYNNLHLLYFRYKTISSGQMSTWKIARNFALFLLPTYGVFVLPLFSPHEFSAVQQATRTPSLGISTSSSSVSGFSDRLNPVHLVYESLLVSGFFANTIFGSVWVRSTKLALNMSSFSPKMKKHSWLFIMGLAIQLIIPTLILLLLYAISIVLQFANINTALAQYSFVAAVALLSIADPLINTFCVVSYRNHLASLCCGKPTMQMVHITSDFHKRSVVPSNPKPALSCPLSGFLVNLSSVAGVAGLLIAIGIVSVALIVFFSLRLSEGPQSLTSLGNVSQKEQS